MRSTATVVYTLTRLEAAAGWVGYRRMTTRKGGGMALLRRLLGEALRRRRHEQHRTLREVSTAARVSLGYLSEIERGQKEASSELLASICEALDVRLSELLREVSDDLATSEQPVPAGAVDRAA